MILIMMLLRKMQRTCSDKHHSVCLPLCYIFLHDSWYLSNHIGLITFNGSKNDALGIYHLRPGAQGMTLFSLMADLKPNKYTGIRAAFVVWVSVFCVVIQTEQEKGYVIQA